ncbi:MAG: hypothetical protein V8S08_09840 [Lachnoclostridium sp.]
MIGENAFMWDSEITWSLIFAETLTTVELGGHIRLQWNYGIGIAEERWLTLEIMPYHFAEDWRQLLFQKI